MDKKLRKKKGIMIYKNSDFSIFYPPSIETLRDIKEYLENSGEIQGPYKDSIINYLKIVYSDQYSLDANTLLGLICIGYYGNDFIDYDMSNKYFKVRICPSATSITCI